MLKRFLLVLTGAALAALLAASPARAADDCRFTASVSVTAAATTEIVALTTGQRIRICSVAISMTATGTAKFVTGTGTNCGTGTADMTPAMTLATGAPLALNSGDNTYLLEAPVSQAICMTAATGNIAGWVRYQKF